jgi:raffinose/stachyose/melibiose transport system permease protein
VGWLFVLPALVMYVVFVLQPLVLTIQYSLYRWDGVGPATWVGLANYATVLSDPRLVETLFNAFRLVVFYSLIPVGLGLVTAAVIHRVASGRLGTISRTVLFLPQVIPLVAAGIIWGRLLSLNGPSTRRWAPSASVTRPRPGSATSTRRCPPSGSSASGSCWASAPSCS